MAMTVAANDPFVKHASESLKCGDLGVEIPKGHVGPVLLSGTGRTVWWTGRVAIGLRYERPDRGEQPGESALWLQDLMLKCG